MGQSTLRIQAIVGASVSNTLRCSVQDIDRFSSTVDDSNTCSFLDAPTQSGHSWLLQDCLTNGRILWRRRHTIRNVGALLGRTNVIHMKIQVSVGCFNSLRHVQFR